MKIYGNIFFYVFVFSSMPAVAGIRSTKQIIELCTSSDKLDLNPFRKLTRQEHGYLSLIAMPIISKNPETRAVLESWTFSKDGRTFLARIQKGLAWQDGSQVTSKDVAISIAHQLQYREIGQKIEISGLKKPDRLSKLDTSRGGIEIIDYKTFKLNLHTEIENIQGVFREALTEGSRGNRFFIIKDAEEVLQSKKEPEYILSQYAISKQKESLNLNIKNSQIRITTRQNCKNPSLADSDKFAPLFKNEYSVAESNNQQALIALISANDLFAERKIREQLAIWLRGTIANLSAHEGIDIPSSHFGMKEPGGGTLISWPVADSTYPKVMPKTLKVFIFSENTKTNIFGKAIEDSVRKAGGNVKWISRIEELRDAHVALSPTKVSQGRQIWFQELSTNKPIWDFLNRHNQTLESLTTVTARSSATIPTDNVTLQNFERSAFEEKSIVPIARFKLKLFSSKESPFLLQWSAEDDWVLQTR